MSSGAHRRIILPLIRVDGWRARAACTDQVKEMLWDDRVEGESDPQRDARHVKAKAVCNRDCPVRDECADDVDWQYDEGIRGGHLLPPHWAQHTPEEAELVSLLRKGWPLDQAARAAHRIKERTA